jgi:hypothetical protein
MPGTTKKSGVANPVSTGGGGVHFESKVAAYYLATLLSGGPVRGQWSGSAATTIKLQRAFEGIPLDDVIIECIGDNASGRLDLQAKRTLVVGDNKLFREVIGACWDTYLQAPENSLIQYGVAIGTPDLKIENYGRQVLTWARESHDEHDFFERMATKKLASDDARSFLKTVRNAVAFHSGENPSGEAYWKFLRRLVVMYFDFESADSSQCLVDVTERLRNCLASENAQRAPDLWNALVRIADEAKPAAGSLDRATLIERLQPSFKLAGDRSLARDIERISDASDRVLEDTKTDILGVTLARAKFRAALDGQFSKHDLVEIVGEAGSGKSALARSHLEQQLIDGTLLAMSSRRLPQGNPGWEGQANYWKIDGSLREIVQELSAAGNPCLFIDGAERIGDPGNWATINDVLREITQSPSGKRWKILVTCRKNNPKHREQIDFASLGLTVGRIELTDFTEDELDEMAKRVPMLREILKKGSRARAIASRPYLLNRLANANLNFEAGESAITEVDLMLDFWRTASIADPDEAELRYTKQEALIKLGCRRLANLDGAISSLNVNARALAVLEQDDVVRHNSDTREIVFAHDVIEDWVLCLALHHSEQSVTQAIKAAGEPLRLIDAVQLLSQWRIERNNDPAEWENLLGLFGDGTMQPRWERAVLTAPLLSTRAPELLVRMQRLLWAEDHKFLDQLILSIRTVEVDPNPRYLECSLFPDLNESDRAKLSQHFALPRARSWRPFVNWFLPFLENAPLSTARETSHLFDTIASAYSCVPDWMAERVASWATRILQSLTYSGDFMESFEKKRALLDEIGIENEHEFRDRLLSILFHCVSGAPEQVISHLTWMAAQDRPAGVEFVIENSALLAVSIPKELVDVLLKFQIKPLPEEEGEFSFGRRSSLEFNELCIQHDRLYFSASHLRPPFLPLLYRNPSEALRLICGLCNAAMESWRQILREERWGTPIPITLEFPWGRKEFWGHFREYTWNRGMGPGPYTVMSGLMALEVWMEKEVEGGRDPIELFQQILTDNECIGTVGACAAVSLRYPERCLEAALPLICHPQLWEWDLRRSLQDRRDGSNTIGMPKDAYLRRAVAERNSSPHRQMSLRNLIPNILVTGSQELKGGLAKRIEILRQNGPVFEIEEQRGDAEVERHSLQQIEIMTEMAKPENWVMDETDEDGRFTYQYVPPPNVAPTQEFVDQHTEMNEAIWVAMWAERSIEAGVIQEELSLSAAIEIVRTYQDSIDFSAGWPPADELRERGKMGALAGAAALALQTQEPGSSEFNWAKEVVESALQLPVEDDGVTFPKSAAPFHPVVSAAYGLTKLLERGVATDADKGLILRLLCHPLDAVRGAAYKGIANSWGSEPAFCWEAMVLGTCLCVVPTSIFQTGLGAYGLRLTQERAEWTIAELKRSHAAIVAKETRSFPRILPHWVLKNSRIADPADRESYVRSNTTFLWDALPTVLFSQPFDQLTGTSERRANVIQLLSDLMDWTEMDCSPPWGHSNSGTSFEWISEFMGWWGKILPFLSQEEWNNLLLEPLRSLIGKREGEYLLDDILTSILTNHVSQNELVDEDVLAGWEALMSVLLSDPRLKWHQRSDFVSSGTGTSIVLFIFSYSRPLYDHPWRPLDQFRPHIERWVEHFGDSPAYFSYLIEFLMCAGRPLLLSPGANWVSNAIDRNANNDEFWKSSVNGERASEFISLLINEHKAEIEQDRPLLRELIRTTDQLVAKGVRSAASLQQQLAVLEGRR